MGRKKLYENAKDYEAGAPRLVTRVDPEVLEWIESRPEKPRPYIEKLVKADKAATLANQPLSGEAEQAAEA